MEQIDDFPNHPFKVRDNDEDMIQLVESITERGVITPATVRKKMMVDMSLSQVIEENEQVSLQVLTLCVVRL